MTVKRYRKAGSWTRRVICIGLFLSILNVGYSSDSDSPDSDSSDSDNETNTRRGESLKTTNKTRRTVRKRRNPCWCRVKERCCWEVWLNRLFCAIVAFLVSLVTGRILGDQIFGESLHEGKASEPFVWWSRRVEICGVWRDGEKLTAEAISCIQKVTTIFDVVVFLILTVMFLFCCRRCFGRHLV